VGIAKHRGNKMSAANTADYLTVSSIAARFAAIKRKPVSRKPVSDLNGTGIGVSRTRDST
jgi:hypothetical protein